MFWLTFETAGGIQVRIVKANYLALARIKAGMAGQKGHFMEGHPLDAKTVKKIPPSMVDRTLSHQEAHALFKRLFKRLD